MIGITDIVGVPGEGVAHRIELHDVGISTVYNAALIDIDRFGVNFYGHGILVKS